MSHERSDHDQNLLSYIGYCFGHIDRLLRWLNCGVKKVSQKLDTITIKLLDIPHETAPIDATAFLVRGPRPYFVELGFEDGDVCGRDVQQSILTSRLIAPQLYKTRILGIKERYNPRIINIHTR